MSSRRSLFWPATLIFGTVLLSAVGLGLFLRAPAALPVADEPARYPSEWMWQQRSFPHGQADPDAYAQALATRRSLAETASKQSPFGAWTLAGPTNVGGRISALAYDPLHPDTVYAGAATGGVFKSIDGGETWRPIFDDQAVLTVGAVAVDPIDTQTLYVGTGEANGGHNNFAGGGVYKSTDGGETWRLLGLEATTSIGRIRVDPSNPQRVFVAAAGSYFGPSPHRGVYRSEDGGLTWTQVLYTSETTGAIDLIQHPDNPDLLLAALWDRVRTYEAAQLYGVGSAIYRSEDGGTTWSRLGPAQGLPDPATLRDAAGAPRIGRIGLALSAQRPHEMAALFTDGSDYLGLYRSSDAGLTWRDADPDDDVDVGTAAFSWYFGQVRLHPTNPAIIFALDVALMRSTNDGADWTYQFHSRDLHVDHHALAFHPTNPNRVLSGHDGGISISDDGGTSWRRVDGLPITQFYEVGLDPSNPDRLLGGTQDNGTILGDARAPDAWTSLQGGDGFYTLVDPRDPDVFYTSFQFGILRKTTNGGQGFQPALDGVPANERRNWSTPVAMDPSNPDVLYYGTHRIYRTTNGAATWTAISPRLPRTNDPGSFVGTLTTIAVAPTDPNVVYAGTDDGTVWRTADGGRTWDNLTTDALPFRWVTRVAADPTDADIAYVTFSGLKWVDPTPHVFRTTDGGRSWQAISTGLPDAPVNAFAVDPVYPQVLYVGTDVGAFVSRDAGASWTMLGAGLPAVPINDLKVHPMDRVLVAGTHGRSMYRLDLSGLDQPTATSPTPTMPGLALEPPYPNPSADRVQWGVAGAEAGGRLMVYDLLGRTVRVLTVAPGADQVTWDGTDAAGRSVPAGAYVARLQTPYGVSSATTLIRTR
ncbi:MAG: FlgD immunoglobulin-like domain containing protein [Bacteroidota bacterium]